MRTNNPNQMLKCGNWTGILLAGIIFLLHLSASATIFSVKKNGSFDQEEIWIPRYPGNIINETDTVIISHSIEQNVDLVVKGSLIIREGASFMGSKNIIIVKTGTILNLGTCQLGLLTNRGAIYNQNNLEVLMDFTNSGNVINHKKIEVGNMLDNTGILTGKDGTVSAERKLLNSRTGTIKGYLDICSNNFINVDGGQIDKETTTFCGNPILSESSLLSKQSDPIHFEKSVSLESIFEVDREAPR